MVLVACSNNLVIISAINDQKQSADINALPVNGTVKIAFSNKVDSSTVNVNTLRVFKVSGNIPVAIAAKDITLSDDGMTASIAVTNTQNYEKATDYKVVVNGVKQDGVDSTIANKEITFKTSNTSVVTAKFAQNLASGLFDANDSLTLTYDNFIAPETATTSNITLTKVSDGSRVAITPSVTGKTLSLQLLSALTDGKQYVLTISNLKTSTGYDAENYSYTFTTNAAAPTVATAPTTIDAKVLNSASTVTGVWPRLTSGTNAAATYFAGLQFNIKFNTKLDATTINDNIVLEEKETEAVVPTTLTYNDDAKTVTLVPKGDLKENTDYVILVKTDLESNLGASLGDSNVKNYVFTTQDLTAPTVSSVTSKNGTSGLKVADKQEFTLQFSEDMGTVGYTSSTSASTGVLGAGQVAVVKAGADLTALTSGDVVDATISPITGVDGAFKVSVAANKLIANQTYKLIIFGNDSTSGTAIKDAGDVNTLNATYVYAFTSEGEDVTPPTLVNVFKGDSLKAADAVTTLTNVAAGDIVTAQFSEPLKLDGSSNLIGNVTLEQFVSNKWVAVDASKYKLTTVKKADADGNNTAATITFTAIDSSIQDAKLRLVLDNSDATGFRDLKGNIIKDKAYFEFVTTAGDDTVTSVQACKDASTSITNLPSSTIDSTVDGKLLVTFAETSLADVTSSNIVVKDAAGNSVAGTFAVVDGTTNKFLFTPTNGFATGTTYSVVVDGVKDTVGNSIAKFVTSFKTLSGVANIVSTSVADGATNVDRQKTMTVVFDKAVTLAGGDKIEVEDGSGNPVGTVTPSTNLKTYTITFASPLTSFKSYKLVVKSAANVIDETYNFITGSVATDDVIPTLAATGTISDGTNTLNYTDTAIYDLAASSNINVKFSEDIDVSTATVTIVDLADTSKTIGTLPLTCATDTLTITTAANLTLNTNATTTDLYKVTIKGVTDLSGNPIDDLVLYLK